MIRSINIIKPTATPVKWVGDVAALKEPREFKFTPGLNILWGKNGSGKTTVLKLLARLFHCEQSGTSVVREESMRELFGIGMRSDDKAVFDGVTVDHDGQAVRHFDPAHAVGLMAGGAL